MIVGKDKHEEKHSEGSYYLAHAGQWIPVGDKALEAERRRRERVSLAEYQRLSRTAPVQSSGAATASGKTPLAAARSFSNCQKRGLSAKTIRKYRAAVDPFVQHCGVTYVDECRDNKQSSICRARRIPQCKPGFGYYPRGSRKDEEALLAEEEFSLFADESAVTSSLSVGSFRSLESPPSVFFAC